MKIYQQGQSSATERNPAAQRTPQQSPSRAETRATSTARQVGLDRIEVSSVAQTAAHVMEVAGQQREERVTYLTGLVRSGHYRVDTASLSGSIVDDDTHDNADYAS